MIGMFGMLSGALAIDFGTSAVRVYMKDKGIVMEEPNVVAVHSQMRRQVLAIGEEAKTMMGRTPGGISAICPVQGGVIADFDVAEVMLKYLIRKAKKQIFSIGRPRTVIAVPCGITPVEARAMDEAARNAGAGDVYLVEGPIAAALGANLSITEPMGSMIVTIGAGACEAAVLSLGGIVTARSTRNGGDQFDAAIVDLIKRDYDLVIGQRTAQEIKVAIGSAVSDLQPMSVTIRGRDVTTGFPKSLQVDAQDIYRAIEEPLSAVLSAIEAALASTPPELSADIMQRGIVLTGGGALLHGLDALISQETGIPVFVADDPTHCVILGVGKLMQNKELLRAVASNTREEQ